jgi:hypothetical protein
LVQTLRSDVGGGETKLAAALFEQSGATPRAPKLGHLRLGLGEEVRAEPSPVAFHPDVDRLHSVVRLHADRLRGRERLDQRRLAFEGLG